MILAFQQWSAPPVLMLLCLLLIFNGKVERTVDVEYVEVFAGVAEISKACRAHGMVGSSHDLTYSPHYDLCGRTGFLYHGLSRNCFWANGFWSPIICSYMFGFHMLGISSKSKVCKGVCKMYSLVKEHS